MPTLRRSLLRLAIRASRARVPIACAATLIFCAALVPLVRFAGRETVVLIVVPVLIMAWIFGRRVGLLVAFLVPLTFMTLHSLVDVAGARAILSTGPLRLVMLMAIAITVGWLSDLTLRLREHETALAKSARRFRAVIQHAMDGVAIIDKSGQTIYQSPAVARILGSSPDELQGTRAQERIHRDDLAATGRHFGALFETPGATCDSRLRVRHADGSWRVLEYHATNLLHDPNIQGIVINYRDITDRQAAEEALRQSAESFTSIFEAAGEGMVIHEDGPLLLVNRAFAAMVGYEVEEATGRDGIEFLAPEAREISKGRSDARDEQPYRAALLHRDGTRVPVELAGKAIRYQGRPARLVTVRDIGARQAAEEALRRSEAGLAEAQRIAQMGSWTWDAATDRVTWTAELYRIYGLTPGVEDTSLGDYLSRIHPDDRERVRGLIKATCGDAERFDSEHRIVRPDGTIRLVQGRGIKIRDADGRMTGMIGTSHDITERMELEARLAHQATHDPLTGLPNRALFLDRLGQAVAHARRDGAPCAVLFLDLDRFKEVNDSLGHAAGDALLVAVAGRLRAALREVDTLARLGGDEFALLLERVTDLGEALRVAARLQAALATPLPVHGREIFARTSIGVALRSCPADGPEELLRYADVALYRAKAAGGACAEAFHPDMNAEALARLELEHDLHRALQQGEMRIHYQPKVDLATGTIAAIEALARWQHPTRGLVPPGEFIPLAEETGLIVPIGQWMLAESCRQLRDWQDRYPGRPTPVLAVNLSARQFRHPDLVEQVAATLAASRLDPRRFRLEVTETVAMERAEGGIATLEKLHDLGISLAIDDFGTGYSSLSYLQRLPVDALKIDRSFFREGERNRAIVCAVTDLAHGLGLQVVAEGLETAAQVALAREAGCDRGQGYYFSPPLPAEEMEAWLARGPICAMPGQVPLFGATMAAD